MLSEFFIFLIKVYRVLFAYRKPCCRFVPTCSSYAIEALRKHGSLRGSFLAIKRICRCHAGSSIIYDPVPDNIILVKNFTFKRIRGKNI